MIVPRRRHRRFLRHKIPIFARFPNVLDVSLGATSHDGGMMSESPVTEVQEPAQQPPRPALRLVVARSEAAERLKNQLKIGSAIRDQRVRDMWELNHARAEKQEW